MDTRMNFKNTLFLDIETVSESADFSQLLEARKEFWVKKAKNMPNALNMEAHELYFERAALYPEFGKIIVIGMGFLFANKEGEMSLKVKTIANTDEKELLKEFIQFINNHFGLLISF